MSSASDEASVFQNPRIVVKKILAGPQSEGDGAVVRRSIGRYYFRKRVLEKSDECSNTIE